MKVRKLKTTRNSGIKKEKIKIKERKVNMEI
jgi:hypothetical protein